MAWLVRDGEVLASAELAATRAERRRGLLGRDEVDGVMCLPVRSIHTIGMRFAIDVAHLDVNGVVLKVHTVPPNRVTLPVRSTHTILETSAGAFRSWGVVPGDQLEIR